MSLGYQVAPSATTTTAEISTPQASQASQDSGIDAPIIPKMQQVPYHSTC